MNAQFIAAKLLEDETDNPEEFLKGDFLSGSPIDNADDKARKEALDEFVRSYALTALWSTADVDGLALDETYDVDDIDDDTMRSMRDDCEDFITSNLDLLQKTEESIAGYSVDYMAQGRDFWLSRNGHGAGFFDHGWEDVWRELQAAARVYGTVNLSPTEDGKITA